MALDTNFKAHDIREVLDATHMRGRNITFIDEFSSEEILSLFQAAEMFRALYANGAKPFNRESALHFIFPALYPHTLLA